MSVICFSYYIIILDLHKTCGVGEIPADILKGHDSEMAPVLSKLYNKCFATSFFQLVGSNTLYFQFWRTPGKSLNPKMIVLLFNYFFWKSSLRSNQQWIGKTSYFALPPFRQTLWLPFASYIGDVLMGYN